MRGVLWGLASLSCGFAVLLAKRVLNSLYHLYISFVSTRLLGIEALREIVEGHKWREER